MIDYLEGLTVAWLTLCLLFAVRRLRKGHRSCILFVFVVFYAFFGLPLLIDLLFGLPGYSQEPGFLYASQDLTARAIYCCFVAAVPLIWSKFVVARDTLHMGWDARSSSVVHKMRWVWFALLVSPVALLPLAPNPELYWEYGFILGGPVGETVTTFHSVMMAATFVATVAAGAFVATAKRAWITLLLIGPFVGAAVWLNGKRAVFAVAVVVLLTALWLAGKLRGRRLILASAAAIALTSAFSYSYQLAIRQVGLKTTTADDFSENLRVDYTRDSRVKMAILAEMPGSSPILEYRGETVLFDVVAWIPRKFWPDKPYPFSRYFTSAMLGSLPTDLDWAMTTTIFDETIANFGWVGLILGPLLVGCVCRVGESCGDPLIHLLTMITASLLLAVEVPAFAPLMLLWCALVVKKKVRLSAQPAPCRRTDPDATASKAGWVCAS